MTSLGLLSLNEMNFELVAKYLAQKPAKYKNLEYLLAQGIKKTSSESEYDLLEPWIQWPSVQTGLSFADHKIFRLGDINDLQHPQIYEIIENLGLSVGAVSPMNAANRMVDPAYFIPDPWTQTSCKGPKLVELLYQAIKQAVGDNAANKVTLLSKLYILIGLLRYSRLRAYPRYFSVIRNRKSIPGSKALILDLLLNELHLSLFKRWRPNFTHLFLNSFAHIQHHYMLSSSTDIVSKELQGALQQKGQLVTDPFPQALKVYDLIVGDFLGLKDNEAIVATGLSQIPYNKIKYYYRLKNHKNFLRNILKIQFESVNALMTRDFVINFKSLEHALKAETTLAQVRIENSDVKIFGEIENRGSSLFVTLTHGDYIDDTTEIICQSDGNKYSLEEHVVFVAIKNGMHNAVGYVVTNNDIVKASLYDQMHVKEIGISIINFFKRE
ncbi:hypothetical protein N8468_03335 [Planktomarina temperata]|nr:hypothetical protein [Planktomarina temperata]